ncbi:MAG: cell division protein ZapA [Bdellovibrionales bacterium]|jgi:hypothetical protein|nr:cell division protein ZapA [Bdellovibrionales bacterium]MBT3526530.1 cell division protein ZapA [Bdellovibrionales bacterium]MBT7767549.1 cell division protein ZapA [Bdellovibrionales bacterium]
MIDEQSNQDSLKFNILGYNVNFKPESGDISPYPEDVVKMVRSEIEDILDKSPGLDRGQVGVLAALRVATKSLNIESEYRINIEKLQLTAKDALQLIDEVSLAQS